MKIEITDNSGGNNIKECEFPSDYKYFGEEEFRNDLKIFIRQDVLHRMDEYLSSDTNNELGGVLTGDVCVNHKDEKFIVADNFIVAEHTNSSISRLTFTHETWDHINEVLEKDFPGKKILGWFHSHPGHTVFLSNYDIFIQENFFNTEYSVAYVFDPTINDRGFFSWRDKKIVKSRGYYVCDITDENEFENLIEIKSGHDLIDNEFPDKKKKRKLTIESKNFIILGLLLLTILLVLFMVYNYYDLKKNALLKEEYSRDLAQIKIENQKLADRLNDMLIEYEFKKRTLNEKKDINSEVPPVNEKSESNIKTQETNKEVTANTTTTPEKKDSAVNLKKYTVRSGDTIEKISYAFYKSRSGIDVILKQNNIKNKADIKIGQVLELPNVSE